MPLNESRIEPRLLDFVKVAEDLRMLRKQRTKQPSSSVFQPGYSITKRWTLEELYTEVPRYRDIRSGKTKSIKSRDLVMALADYLECTLEERNQLLIFAELAPEDPYLSGPALEQALEAARRTMHYLPMPSFIITRDWTVHDWNSHLLTFIGWAQEQVEAILSLDQLNVLHLTFNPIFGLRDRLDARGSWEKTAWRNVYGFISSNTLCRHDDWYLKLIAGLSKLRDFNKFYYSVINNTAPSYLRAHLPYTNEILAANEAVIEFNSLFTCTGDLYYPHVVSFTPANEESRQAFAALGLPVPGDIWKTLE